MIVQNNKVYSVLDKKTGKYYDGLSRIDKKYLYNTREEAQVSIDIAPDCLNDADFEIIEYNLERLWTRHIL